MLNTLNETGFRFLNTTFVMILVLVAWWEAFKNGVGLWKFSLVDYLIFTLFFGQVSIHLFTHVLVLDF